MHALACVHRRRNTHAVKWCLCVCVQSKCVLCWVVYEYVSWCIMYVLWHERWSSKSLCVFSTEHRHVEKTPVYKYTYVHAHVFMGVYIYHSNSRTNHTEFSHILLCFICHNAAQADATQRCVWLPHRRRPSHSTSPAVVRDEHAREEVSIGCWHIHT